LKKSHREKAESTRAHKSKPIVTRSVENLDLNQISLRAMHIPFRGAEGLNEVMAGRVDLYCIPVAPAVPLINAGKVTVLAVSTRKRAALLPNVPTVAEAG
jgi:tripartite-type tricarboxylate transporter receptor subunit TctC